MTKKNWIRQLSESYIHLNESSAKLQRIMDLADKLGEFDNDQQTMDLIDQAHYMLASGETEGIDELLNNMRGHHSNLSQRRSSSFENYRGMNV